MKPRHRRFARAAFFALCLTAPALAATPPNLDGTGDPDNLGLDVTRHAMPPPDVTAKPQEAQPPVSANPLWAVPLSALAATRNRPLFTPSRRPPAAVVANAPVVAPVRQAPPPTAPEHPNLALIGTVAGDNESVAVFIDNTTHDAVRLRTGEGHAGWVLQSVDRRAVTLQKGGQTETLELPKPGAVAQGAAPPPLPVISPLPPPPLPPPQSSAPASGNQPQQTEGCMPEPVGC
jgi:hypothetical protein